MLFSIIEPGLTRELFAILSLYLGTLLNGYSFGFSAVAIPDINKEMRTNASLSFLPKILASDEELSWFASIINLMLVPGSLVGGYVGGRFGPKKAIMINGVLGTSSWLLLCLSPHLATLILARIINGLGLGFAAANCALLVAQYSSLKYRGGFLSLYTLMMGLGILLCNSLGAGLYWRTMAAVPVVLCLLSFCCLLAVPESPLWLLGHRGPHEARLALRWLRQTEDVEAEIIQIQNIMEDQSHGITMTEALRNLSKPYVRTPFLLVTINYWLVLISGPPIIIFYSVSIFQNLSQTIDKHIVAILSASVQVIGGIVGIFLVQKLPRVKLNMVSMSLMSVCMAALGTALYLKESQGVMAGTATVLDTVQCVAVVLYMFSFGAGSGPLIFVLMGEILPREYKVLSGIVNAVASFPIFVLTKVFPTLQEAVSPGVPFWILAALAGLANLFYFFFLPETKGKTALEIKQIFLKHKVKADSVSVSQSK